MEPNYRCCISCRKVGPKSDFWRIVRVHPSRAVQLDQGMGRSAYLCPQAGCLRAAQKKNKLGRSLRVAVPEALYQALWHRLTAPTAKSTSDDTVGEPLSGNLPQPDSQTHSISM